MPALSCRNLVFLAFAFVTAVSAVGPTPTSSEEPVDLYARVDNGGGPYGGDRGSGGRYYNGGGNSQGNNGWGNSGSSNNNGGGPNGGWGNGGGPNNNGGGPNGGWGNGGGPNNNGWNNGGNDNGYPTPSQRPRQRVTRRLNPLTAFELAEAICPSQLSACPIAEAGSLSALPTSIPAWTEQGFECVDLKADLRACGGCPSLNSKYDCTSIEGANDIACVEGQCVVDSCRAGYTLDSDKSTCQRK